MSQDNGITEDMILQIGKTPMRLVRGVHGCIEEQPDLLLQDLADQITEQAIQLEHLQKEVQRLSVIVAKLSWGRRDV